MNANIVTQVSVDPIDLILSRLDGVITRSNGQYLARCPAHEDKSPSLSVRETDDGTILIHCFAGCAAYDITSAVGLNLSDLFPPRDTHHHGPVEKRPNYKSAWLLAKRAFWVLIIASEDLKQNRKLSDTDLAAVRQAHARITSVMGIVNNE